MIVIRISLFLTIFFITISPVLAAKPEDVETDFPLTIEDASPTDAGELDLRMMSRYEHTDSHDERVHLAPEFEYGVGYNTEVNVTLPFNLGSADDNHGGDLGVELLHGFIDEKNAIPEISASVKLDMPTGENSAGLDATLRVLATKHILQHYGQHAVHFNAGWSYNAAERDDERNNSYQIALGSSHGITDKTFLVMDVVREQDKENSQTENLLEVGLRHEVAQDTIASLATGIGIGQESPDFRLTFGIQKTF